MKWFGPEPWAPMCDPTERVAIQVGKKCCWCDELIGLEDSGVVVPIMMTMSLDQAMQDTWTRPLFLVEHRECFARQLFGGPEHLLGTCTCHRKNIPETVRDFLVGARFVFKTKREEALFVWRFMQL